MFQNISDVEVAIRCYLRQHDSRFEHQLNSPFIRFHSIADEKEKVREYRYNL